MTHHNTYGSPGNYPTLAKSGRTWGTVEFKTWRDTSPSSSRKGLLELFSRLAGG
jgi:hypothetical protein